MSSKPKESLFQKARWNGSDLSQRSGTTGTSPPANHFSALAPVTQKTHSAMGFESPYVSKEKLKEIREADLRLQGLPGPDVEETRRQAYAEGFAKGEAEGFIAGQQKARPIVDQLQRLVADIGGMWPIILNSYERQLMELVCRVAEKIVLGRVEIDDEMVRRAILNAFSVVPEPVGVTIEINPRDYEFIETIKEDFFECIQSLKDVTVSADPSVGRGGCKLRTAAGEVDATIQSRLEAVRKCIIETHGRKEKP